jgi:glycosyltransferase involved in cell wall biosynthesis
MSNCIVLAIGEHWDSGSSSALGFKALADELVKRGNQVIILVPGQRIDIVVRVGNPLIFTWPSRRPTKLQDAIFFARTIKLFKPNCLIANWAATNWMMLIGKILSIPVRIAWNHTLVEQIDLDWTRSILEKRYLRFRKRLIYNMATTVASVSFSAQNELQKIYKVPLSKCIVFHNAIEDPLRNHCDSINLTRNLQIICPGRLNESKGQHVLIRAISLLRNEFPDLKATFLGDGPSKEELITLSQQLGVMDNCHFPGRVPHHELLERMAQAYITVVPSRSEAFGFVNIESMSVGTPVIGSNVGGIPEIIRNGIDGYLFHPDDAVYLAKKISALLAHPEILNEMSKNARQRFLNEFEVEKAVKIQADWLEIEIQKRLEK